MILLILLSRAKLQHNLTSFGEILRKFNSIFRLKLNLNLSIDVLDISNFLEIFKSQLNEN